MPSSCLYNLSSPEHEAVERYINDLLAAGIIRPSSSRWVLCINYRDLNKIIVKNKYPIPLINSGFTPLYGTTIFIKLDLRNAYHRMCIREEDEWKMAFNTPLGQFEYLVMPLGLTNAPAFFQNLVNDVL